MTAGVVGLGLMGGSLAKALKRAGYAGTVAVTRDPSALNAAMTEGVIAVGSSGFAALADCDLVFICVPVDAIAEAAENIARHVKPGCILTDVGSVKRRVLAAVNNIDLRGAVFVGGHPMAGSEQSGYAAATETLYDGAKYIITPNGHEDAAARLAAVARDIGAEPIVMDAAAHDRVTAMVSHAPHAFAAALVNAVQRADDGMARQIAASGFRDTTRISSGDPDLWRGITLENRDEILHFLRVLQAELADFERMLANKDGGGIRAFYARAKDYRDQL